MPVLCDVPGCSKFRVGYARLCSTHRSRKRRHGHEEQPTISRAMLRPFVERVKARIAKQPDAKLWAICDQRWDSAASEWRTNPPETYYRAVRQGSRELVRLADTVSARDAAVTTMAMYLMQAEQPRLFKSDDGFHTQLVRQVRGLSKSSFSRSGGAADGRERRALKEMDRRTVAYLGELLAMLFGPAGLKVAKLERLEEEAEHNDRLAYFDALAELK